MLYPTIKAMFDYEAKAQDQRPTVAVPSDSQKPSSDNGLVLCGGLVIGGAAIWAAIANQTSVTGNLTYTLAAFMPEDACILYTNSGGFTGSSPDNPNSTSTIFLQEIEV